MSQFIDGVVMPPIIVKRLLVTGGRDFMDDAYVYRWLEIFRQHYDFRVLIHGGARGVDAHADWLARAHGIQPVRCDALWDFFKSRGMWRAAGHVRNARMLDLRPNLVLAFPGGDGTDNMLRQARDAEVPCVDLRHQYKQEHP
jgi:hypothetical protein